MKWKNGTKIAIRISIKKISDIFSEANDIIKIYRILSNISRIKVKIILQDAEFSLVTVILLIKKKTNASVFMLLLC